MSLPAALLLAFGLVPGALSSGRPAPPVAVTCPRDHLTSFLGHVIAWKRSAVRITFKVRTDDATTEKFDLRFADNEDAARSFLLDGQPFGPGDWPRIEVAPGRLRERMRAIVWVCDDGSRPSIDWRPPEAARSEQKKEEHP